MTHATSSHTRSHDDVQPAQPPLARAYACQQPLERSVWYVGNLFTFLSTAEDTNGRFTFVEIVARRGLEPPRHIHHREHEAFYILDGRITFYVGDEVFEATSGAYVFLPQGVPHSFVIHTEAARMLGILSLGMDGHFRDPQFSEPARAFALPPMPSAPPDAGKFIADLARYGVEVVGPPGPPATAK